MAVPELTKIYVISSSNIFLSSHFFIARGTPWLIMYSIFLGTRLYLGIIYINILVEISGFFSFSINLKRLRYCFFLNIGYTKGVRIISQQRIIIIHLNRSMKLWKIMLCFLESILDKESIIVTSFFFCDAVNSYLLFLIIFCNSFSEIWFTYHAIYPFKKCTI